VTAEEIKRNLVEFARKWSLYDGSEQRLPRSPRGRALRTMTGPDDPTVEVAMSRLTRRQPGQLADVARPQTALARCPPEHDASPRRAMMSDHEAERREKELQQLLAAGEMSSVEYEQEHSRLLVPPAQVMPSSAPAESASAPGASHGAGTPKEPKVKGITIRGCKYLGGFSALPGAAPFIALEFQPEQVIVRWLGRKVPLSVSLIASVAVEGSESVQKRVTATRVLATGVLALAVPKRSKTAVSYIVIELNNGETGIFQLKDQDPMKVRARLSPWIARQARSSAQPVQPSGPTYTPAQIEFMDANNWTTCGECGNQFLKKVGRCPKCGTISVP
jgi:hypothetical protein